MREVSAPMLSPFFAVRRRILLLISMIVAHVQAMVVV